MSPTKCATIHFGPWLIEPQWFKQTVAAIGAGIIKPAADSVKVREYDEDTNSTRTIYEIYDGVAVIPIEGAMMKIRSKFGGTSTVDVRNALRKAVADERVQSILLHIDSPGGTVAGTDALAQDVADANRLKPVHAHIDDLGASAAYYVASQARRITASNTSLIGSLGVRMSVIDSKTYFENQGLLVHELATGPYKGAGAEGTEITDKHLEYFQGIVDDALGHFKTAVMKGRGFTQEQIDALFDGRVHDANHAKTIGLIDEVSTFDAAMAAIKKEIDSMPITSQQFTTHAAENPAAPEVVALINQGYEQAKAELTPKAATVVELEAAFPDSAAFVLAQLKAGATLADANAVAAKDLSETLAGKDKEIARLQFEAEGSRGVAVKPAAEAVGDKYTALEGDARTEAEWADNHEGCKDTFKMFSAYLGYRRSIAERPKLPAKDDNAQQ